MNTHLTNKKWSQIYCLCTLYVHEVQSKTITVPPGLHEKFTGIFRWIIFVPFYSSNVSLRLWALPQSQTALKELIGLLLFEFLCLSFPMVTEIAWESECPNHGNLTYTKWMSKSCISYTQSLNILFFFSYFIVFHISVVAQRNGLFSHSIIVMLNVPKQQAHIHNQAPHTILQKVLSAPYTFLKVVTLTLYYFVISLLDLITINRCLGMKLASFLKYSSPSFGSIGSWSELGKALMRRCRNQPPNHALSTKCT